MARNYFQQLKQPGIRQNMPLNEAKRIRLVNGLAAIMGSTTCIIVGIAMLTEFMNSGNLIYSIPTCFYILSVGFLSFVPIYLNKIGFNHAAKYYLLILFWALITALSIVYGATIRFDQYFLATLLLPFGLFSKNRNLIFTITISAILYLCCNLYYQHYTPYVVIPVVLSRNLFLIHSCMMLTLVIMLVTFLKKQNELAEKALSTEISEHIATTRELNKANAAKDKFFSIIAHDLKGPIGNFATTMHDLSKDEIPESAWKNLGISAKRTHQLLLDLLTWARSQKKEIEYHPAPIDIEVLFNKAIALLAHAAREKELDLHIAPDSESLQVLADEPSLLTVIRNLVSNSIKFTPSGGKTILKAEKTNGRAYISITDNGVGIEAERLKKLFIIGENDTATRGTNKEPGSGIGLLLCKDFVELNQGEIGANSTRGKGSTFWFTVPLVKQKEVHKNSDGILMTTGAI